jgi:CARDB
MGPDRGTVAMLVVLGALAAPASAVAAKKPPPAKPQPDLKITKLETGGLGEPPFTVVGTNGVAQRFSIHIETENRGDATAPASTTIVLIFDGRGHPYKKKIPIRRLEPKGRVDRTLEITNLEPRVGFAEIKAVADANHNADESDEANNLREGQRFAVIARQWTVQQFTTIITNPLSKSTTDSQPGFRFRFSSYDSADDQFDYRPIGPVTNKQTQTGVCQYSASKTVTQNPWPESYLHIEPDLKHYDAFVSPSAAPEYPVTVTCFHFTRTVMFSFEALVTFVGARELAAMRPSQSELSDDTHSTPLHTRWIWDFDATIPNR